MESRDINGHLSIAFSVTNIEFNRTETESAFSNHFVTIAFEKLKENFSDDKGIDLGVDKIKADPGPGENNISFFLRYIFRGRFTEQDEVILNKISASLAEQMKADLSEWYKPFPFVMRNTSR